MVWLKRGLSLLLLAVVVYLFWPLFKELRAAADLFRDANWPWLPVVLAVQIVSYAFLTWLNVLALRPFPGRIGFGRLAAMLTSMAFIEVAIPSAGASGVALRARLLGKRGGYSVEASTFTLAVETIVLSTAMASVGLLGLAYLFRRGELATLQVLYLAGIALALILAMLGLWRLAMDRQRSRRILNKALAFWNHRFGRIRTLDLQATEARLSAFQSSLVQLQYVPRWKFILAAYGRVALDVATLGACFLLFRHPVSPGTVLTGYGLILVISGLAALPGGLGLADASVPVIFARLGVPGPVALAAGLTYRLIAFWLLRFVGFVSWQYLESKP
jgi:uncharacterized protein (TIRG00374 family)